MPVRRYEIVHTGPKTQFGGVKAGFSIVEYHEVKPSPTVVNEPINPAAKLTQHAVMSGAILFPLMFVRPIRAHLSVPLCRRCHGTSHFHPGFPV